MHHQAEKLPPTLPHPPPIPSHVSLCRTNITEPLRAYASSRGTLVASFLGDDHPCGDLTNEAADLTRQTAPYAGFNLLLLEPQPSSSASASTLAYDARLISNDGGGGSIRSRTLTDAERACGGLSNGVDGRGGDQWPKVVQGRDELGSVLAELSRGPEMDERLTGRLIELLTCVSASGPVPRPLVVGPFLSFHLSKKEEEKKEKKHLPCRLSIQEAELELTDAFLTLPFCMVFFLSFSSQFLFIVPTRRSLLLENARS